MSIYWRYKQQPGGFRNLVELLESTPLSRRQKMIDVGMTEDARFTTDALKYVMEFKDVLDLPEMELAEVLAHAPAQVVAYSLMGQDDSHQKRFLKCAPPKIGSEIKTLLEGTGSPRDISGARMKLIAIARDLERKGLVKTKVIPNAA